MILSISIPILNAIYPVAIVLILLGLFDKFLQNNKYVFKLCIYSTCVISVIYAVDQFVDFGFVSKILSYIPLYTQGFGWVIICLCMLLISSLMTFIEKHKKSVI